MTSGQPFLSMSRRWQAALLFFLLVIASTRLLASYALSGDLFAPYPSRLYQAATLAFNYFEFGPIRRGLGGSIAYLLSSDMMVASTAYHLLSAAAVAAVASYLMAVASIPRVRRVALAVVILAIMMRWAEDPGRSDMAVAAVVALAAAMVVRGRLVTAMVVIGIGLFIHETSFIFGLPLVLALSMRPAVWQATTSRTKWKAAGVVASTLCVYVLMTRLPQSDGLEMAEAVRRKFISSQYVDWAIYFAVSGGRTLGTNLCQNLNDPNYWAHLVSGLIAIALAYVALAWRAGKHALTSLLAATLPFLFISAITNDISRWAMLSCFNLWLVVVVTPQRTDLSTKTWVVVAAALVFMVIVNDKLGRKGMPTIYMPSPLLERIARRLTGKDTPTVETALSKCDPSWRSFVERSPVSLPQ